MEEVVDFILNDPTTGYATVASLRAAGGFVPLKVPAIAYADQKFDSPSGKIEFYSSQAARLGLSPLPVHKSDKDSRVDKGSRYPLALSFGRTLKHFHSFYDVGKALPSLAKHNTAPQLWISPADADARQLADGDAIKIYNDRGEFAAKDLRHQRRAAGCGLDAGWMGRPKSSHIWRSGSDWRRFESFSIFCWAGRLRCSSGGCAKLGIAVIVHSCLLVAHLRHAHGTRERLGRHRKRRYSKPGSHDDSMSAGPR
jgi:anaerobic selenocysteine-containing dehydrogenase